MRPFRVKVTALPYKCKDIQWQVDSFRWLWYEKQLPVKYEHRTFNRLNTIPAITNWVKLYSKPEDRSQPGRFELNYDHFDNYGHVTVPIERTVWAEAGRRWQVKGFERFEAPLSFFLEWTKRKLSDPQKFYPNETLYIAQCPISLLPQGLRDDLPPPVYCTQDNPNITKTDTSGAIKTAVDPKQTHSEDSSIWLGIPPTEKPLHKDPNSNFLVQIAGWKAVRLMKPGDGQLMLEFAKRTIAKQQHAQGLGGRLNMSMRGEEMMVGPERQLMSELVWESPLQNGNGLVEKVGEGDKVGDNIDGNSPEDAVGIGQNQSTEKQDSMATKTLEYEIGGTPDEREDIPDPLTGDQKLEDDGPSLIIWEVNLTPGDALFIPQGWYHSVRSIGNHANGVNVSANWWFRFQLADDCHQRRKF
jgi:hypothetical protein